MTTQIAGVKFKYSHTIGRAEFFGTGFREPVAIARGEEDRLYVLSRSFEHRPAGVRITIITVGEDYIGEFARGVTKDGALTPFSSADGALMWPTSIALDKRSNVYVADELLNRISIFTKDGDWIGKWGTPGDQDGEINGPSGLAFDDDENLFLVDSLNNRIQKFTKEGKFLDNWGTAGSDDGEFNLPWGIDVDHDGYVYVADWRNDRIQKFAPDGRFLNAIGSSGNGDGEFSRPSGVATDKDGIIYVTDWDNERLQVFGPDGRFITKMTGDATLSKWGMEQMDVNPDMWQERQIAQDLEREKQFWGPVAVDVDEQNRVFVAESSRHRIQVYEKQPPVFLAGKL